MRRKCPQLCAPPPQRTVMKSRLLNRSKYIRCPYSARQHNGLARVSQGLAAMRDFGPAKRR